MFAESVISAQSLTVAPEAAPPFTTTFRESVAFESPIKVEVMVIVAVSPIATDAEVADKVSVSSPAFTAADDGATERTPSPNAATATSAMRLKVVFVDILFLSVVVMKTFSMAALR